MLAALRLAAGLLLLALGRGDELERRLGDGARRLEWQNRLTVFLRPLEGEPRPAVPAPGTRLARIEAEGEDRAGIVARICRVLADESVNIADLRSQSLPSPSGAALYRMSLLVEVPQSTDAAGLGKALDAAGEQLGVEIRIEPGE